MPFPLVIRLMLAAGLMPDASYCEALAARPRDAEDIRQLVQVLGLHTVDEVLASVRETFPEAAPPARLRLLLEDIFPVQDE